jgi:hypothetical protein
LRNPPLCEYWQLSETGPHTYGLDWLLNAHEAMDMEAVLRQRMRKAEEKAAKLRK